MAKKKKKEPKKKANPLLEQALNSAADRFGAGAVRTGTEIPDMFRLRRPTGIPTLDLELMGGFPAGGPTQLIGADGSGKSDLAWRTLATAQKNYGEDFVGAMACVEHWPDKSQARFAGLQLAYNDEELNWLEVERGEKLTKGEIEALKRETGTIQFIPNQEGAENLLELTADMYASGAFQVIVVDSLGALLAESEYEKNLDDEAKVASIANLMTRFMKKVWSASMRMLPDGTSNETTMIIINQYREKIGATKYEDPLRHAGGNALKHGKLVDLFLRRGGWIKDSSKKDKIGKGMVGRVLKGKAGMHEGAIAEWDFHFASGVDIGQCLYDMASRFGMFTRGGTKYKFWDGTKITGKLQAKMYCVDNQEHIVDESFRLAKVPPFRVT
jgi:recombination protein RecA